MDKGVFCLTLSRLRAIVKWKEIVGERYGGNF